MAVKISGFCHRRFLPLRDAFRANFDEGLEIGASLAVTHRGRMVVDLWAGYADPERTRPWEKHTIVFVASTTKIMAAISALMLIDRGSIELDERIAHYWPEFVQGGKENVTVRDALTHQAGVPGFDPPISIETFYEWLGVTSLIAAQRHWFGGERVLCYHALTYGVILGELIRRVDGRRPAQFFREEIAKKLHADFQIGLSRKSDLARMAIPRDPPSGPRFPPESLQGRVWNSVDGGGLDIEQRLSDWDFVSADNPSGNGYGNGRSIARICAMIAMSGKLDGNRYLSKEIVKQAGTEQVYAEDPFSGWLRYGLGFGLNSKEFPAPSPTCMHWGGYGGSWAIADPNARVSLGYTPNNFMIEIGMDPRLHRFSDALERLLPTL